MKFAILSDIHGNIFALKECIKYIEKMGIDSIIWCGDYITDIPKSHEVIELIKDTIKKYKSYIIRGNREDYIIEYHNSNNKNWTMENRMASLLCSYNELNKKDIEFISKLPENCIIDIPNIPKIFVSHKRNYHNGNDCMYKIFGHSHKQYIFEREKVKYINPGSVGLTTGGKIGLEFAILEINQYYHKVENYNIPYDINMPIESIKKSMLDKTAIKWGDALIKLLQTGIDYPDLYIKEAQKIAKEHGLDDNLDKMPIEVWNEARKSLNI